MEKLLLKLKITGVNPFIELPKKVLSDIFIKEEKTKVQFQSKVL